MTVSRLRLTQGRIPAAINAFIKRGGPITFTPELEKRSMAGAMTFHQALKCLESGVIVGKAVLNDKGDWEAVMERYAANTLCRIKVIVICNGPQIEEIVVNAEK